MALPPWTVELIRRGLQDAARRAKQPEALDNLRSQASEIWRDLPETAARGVESAGRGFERLMKKTETGTESILKWVRRYPAAGVPCVNATGNLFASCSPPIGDPVIAAGIEALRGSRLHQVDQPLDARRVLTRACQLPDDCQAIATHAFPAAVIALPLAANDQTILVPRSQAIRIDGVPLPDLLDVADPEVQEIGDFRGLRRADTAGRPNDIVVLADDGSPATGSASVSPLASGMTRVAVLSIGVIRQPRASSLPAGLRDLAFAVDLLREGHEVVVLPGSGLLGGPESGLIIGKRERIEAIMASPRWPTLAADGAKVHMLCRAVRGWADNDQDACPTLGMIQTSIDNLRARAERMATRLTASENTTSVQVTDRPCHLEPASPGNDDDGNERSSSQSRFELPSRQIRVVRGRESSEDLCQRLAKSNPAVLVNRDDEAILIDLRWVAPEQDGLIAAALA